MLQTRRYRHAICQVGTLITFHGSFRKHAIGIRIFPITFRNTSPSWIPTHVDHGRKSPIHATHPAFLRRNTASLLHQFRIPTTCLPQWDRENGTKAMNSIIAKQNRNTQSGIFHRMTLHTISQFWVGRKINQRTYLGRNVLHLLTFIILDIISTQCILVQLHYLLFQSHTRQKIFYSFFNRSFCIFVQHLSLVLCA